jgi:hypothetical protein
MNGPKATVVMLVIQMCHREAFKRKVKVLDLRKENESYPEIGKLYRKN